MLTFGGVLEQELFSMVISMLFELSLSLFIFITGGAVSWLLLRLIETTSIPLSSECSSSVDDSQSSWSSGAIGPSSSFLDLDGPDTKWKYSV